MTQIASARTRFAHSAMVWVWLGGVPVAAHGDAFEKTVNRFTSKHCVACHDAREEKGDFRIDTLSRDLSDPSITVIWQDVVDLVTLGEMPPEEMPRPEKAELLEFVSAVQSAIRHNAQHATKQDSLELRRLSHTALDNTAGDLLGSKLKISDGLPADPELAGFDNMSATMGQSSEFMAVLQRNARRLAEATIVEGPDPRVDETLTADDIQPGARVERVGEHWVLWGSKNRSNTVWPRDFAAPRTGVYRISLEAYQTDNRYALDERGANYDDVTSWQNQNGVSTRKVDPSLPKERSRQVAIMALAAPIENALGESTGGRRVATIEIADELSIHELECELEAGESFFVYAVDCPRLQRPPMAMIDGEEGLLGEQFHLRSLRIEGPLVASWPPPPQQSLLVGSQLSQSGLRHLLTRAFRGEVSEETVALYQKIFASTIAQGLSATAAARVVVESVLCSPRFLYHRTPQSAGDGYVLASRLSYFLWNTMPDDELLGLAASGELLRRDVLAAQVKRMIADEKSEGFVVDFTGQWLGLRRVGAMLPDPALYPQYDAALEVSMRAESESLFREILRRNRPVTDFLAPGYAMLNERLARHYGIPGVQGPEIRRVSLPADSPRGGLLGHASMLTITSNGTRTSPVVRGVWVLENLLDSPPAPPPPDVEPIEPDIRGATTIREMLDKHRDLATCNECHRRIDPWGFGLENFNAIGAWRERYGIGEEGKPVDASGRVTGGHRFDGAVEMRDVLIGQSERFTQALAAKLLAHAVGHPTTVQERVMIGDIVARHQRSSGGLQDLMTEICMSPVFRE